MAYVEKSDKSTVETFMGETLNPPLEYVFNWNEFEGPGSVEEAKSAGKWLADKDILERINGDAKLAAKAKAYQDVLKEKRKAYEGTDEFSRKEIYNSIYARLAKKNPTWAAAQLKEEAEKRTADAM
jgi:hypothetical protein